MVVKVIDIGQLNKTALADAIKHVFLPNPGAVDAAAKAEYDKLAVALSDAIHGYLKNAAVEIDV